MSLAPRVAAGGCSDGLLGRMRPLLEYSREERRAEGVVNAKDKDGHTQPVQCMLKHILFMFNIQA